MAAGSGQNGPWKAVHPSTGAGKVGVVVVAGKCLTTNSAVKAFADFCGVNIPTKATSVVSLDAELGRGAVVHHYIEFPPYMCSGHR